MFARRRQKGRMCLFCQVCKTDCKVQGKMLHKSKKTEVNENLTSEVTLCHPSVVMFGTITHHMSWVGTTAFHYHF